MTPDIALPPAAPGPRAPLAFAAPCPEGLRGFAAVFGGMRALARAGCLPAPFGTDVARLLAAGGMRPWARLALTADAAAMAEAVGFAALPPEDLLDAVGGWSQILRPHQARDALAAADALCLLGPEARPAALWHAVSGALGDAAAGRLLPEWAPHPGRFSPPGPRPGDGPGIEEAIARLARLAGVPDRAEAAASRAEGALASSAGTGLWGARTLGAEVRAAGPGWAVFEVEDGGPPVRLVAPPSGGALGRARAAHPLWPFLETAPPAVGMAAVLRFRGWTPGHRGYVERVERSAYADWLALRGVAAAASTASRAPRATASWERAQA